MPAVLDSLVPVLAVIATGWGVRAAGFLSAEDCRGVERATYYVFIPAILIHTLALSDLSGAPVGRVAAALGLPLLAVIGGALALRGPLARRGVDGPAFTSIFQGAVRWNSFVALGLAGALHGKDGLAYCAIGFAVLIPIVNVASLLVLGRYGAGRVQFRIGRFAASLLGNPFVWSTLVGLAIQLAGVAPPRMSVAYADILGKAALAGGLLMVGAGLDLKALRPADPGFAAAAALKLIAFPAMAGSIGAALDLTGAAMATTIVCASVPTAAASYILARQHGGDAPLMAAIITGQTMLSAATMPLMLLLFGA